MHRWRLLARGWCGAALLTATAGLAASAGPGRDGRNLAAPEVQAVLERLDRAQSSIQTLRAEVVETRALGLLTQPQVLRGRLTFERPGKLRWEYSAPDERVYVLVDGRLTGWVPAKNQVERLNVSRHEQRLRRLLTFGQDSKTLLREFDIALAPGAGRPEADELKLLPKSRRLRRRLHEVRLLVDRSAGLPQQIVYVTAAGDRVTLDFSRFQLNARLAPETFALQIPAGAREVQGLGWHGLALGAEPPAAREDL